MGKIQERKAEKPLGLISVLIDMVNKMAIDVSLYPCCISENHLAIDYRGSIGIFILIRYPVNSCKFMIIIFAIINNHTLFLCNSSIFIIPCSIFEIGIIIISNRDKSINIEFPEKQVSAYGAAPWVNGNH